LKHVLFDFGGPLIRTPFELNERAERSMGLPAGSLPRGPFDPVNDAAWAAQQAGRISERDYWSARFDAAGLDMPEYFDHFYAPFGDHHVRPEVAAIVDGVQEAGWCAGVLSNDLSVLMTPQWRATITVLRRATPVIDLGDHGVLKPDRRAYELGIEAVGAVPSDIVFVDDQPANVTAASKAGLVGVWFDVTDVAGSVVRILAAVWNGEP
jgi:putative hydrolase of the HAD superfamily